MAKIPRSQVPVQRRIHVKLADAFGGEEVIVPMRTVTENNGFIGEVGSVIIPLQLMFAAVWIYDIDARKIIKNRTGRNALVWLDVKEVGREWLSEKGFIRQPRLPR